MPDDAPLRILLLEDSPLDAELTVTALDDAAVAHATIRVDTADAFAAALAADGPGPDLILSDYLLPTFNGLAALRVARRLRPDTPFIFVSGALGEELAIESLHDGATDYVVKERLGRLGPAVRRAVRESADRRARSADEHRYRFLADVVPQIVWTARPDGRVDHTNARWAEYTGLTPGQTAAGHGIAAAVHPDDLPAARAAWDRSVATGEPFEAEHRLRRHDGEYRWHLARAVPRRDAGGGHAVVQWVGTATDVDDQRRAAAEHRRLLGQLDAIISTMNEGLVVADGGGRVLSMNAAGLRLYGLSSVDSWQQGRFSDLADRIAFATPDGQPVPTDRWPLARALAGETFTDLVLRVDHPAGGRPPWVASYAGTAIRDADGRVHMASVTFRDVTAQQQAAADLARAKRDADDARDLAQAANQSKDDFLATLSHELRTPLNAILGWTQLLQADLDGGIDPADLRQGLATVDRNARVQAQLVEDLLDVSRIAAGKLRLSCRSADLRAVVAAAVDGGRPAAAAKSVTVDAAAAIDGPPATLVGDPDRLQQVAWNLLTNAIKFTPAGGTVTVAVGPADGGWELSVTDTGQGIAADFLPYVFDRFRQADSSAQRQHGGLGLGLAIVRHLVELHGGRVSVDSDGPGRGATFRVWLPAGAAAADAPVAAPVVAASSLVGTAVLVVDDDPDARAVTAMMLAREGAAVTTAASAAEGVAAVTAGRPAVLVSDIAMPGGDGYGLIAAVRRLPPQSGGRTPAVALTAFARPADRDRALAAGFDAHLSKPLDAAALVATVASLAHRRPAVPAG